MTYPIINGTATATVHPQFHNAYVDAKAHYGVKGDGTSEEIAVIEEFLSNGGDLFFPPGTYYLPDGEGLTFGSQCTIRGAGPNKTIFSVKNAYAFTSDSSGTVSNAEFRDFTVNLRSGSTTGGAVKTVTTGGTANNIRLRNLIVNGVRTCMTGGLHLNGVIGCSIDACVVTGFGQYGLFTDPTGGFCNVVNISNSYFTQVYPDGGGGGDAWGIYGDGNMFTIRGCVLEGDTIGIGFVGDTGLRVEDNWFEACNKFNIKTTGVMGVSITGNNFHYTQGTGSGHIGYYGSGAEGLSVIGNHFQDDEAFSVDIGAGTGVITIMGNDGVTTNNPVVEGALSYDKTIVYDYGPSTYDFGSNRFIRSGTGSPEGVHTASPGALYLRWDGGTGTTLYVKETGGLSNTGWAAK